MTFSGRQLRTLREQRGLSLEEVADALHINVLYLEGLENDLPSDVPPGPYLRLYAIAYSQYLGLTLDDERLPGTASREQAETPLKITRLESKEELRRQRMLLRIGLLILLGLGIVLPWQYCAMGPG